MNIWGDTLHLLSTSTIYKLSIQGRACRAADQNIKKKYIGENTRARQIKVWCRFGTEPFVRESVSHLAVFFLICS